MRTDIFVYAIETEIADAYYGWRVELLMFDKDAAEKEMARLAAINRGINYRVQIWPVYTKGD